MFQSTVEEAATTDEVTCNDWRAARLRVHWKTVPPLYVYNIDETVLFLLFFFFAFGRKHSKQWIMLLVDSNMTGTGKLKLLVIGKAQSPRCLKNIKTLPVRYAGGLKAWMTRVVFEQRLCNICRRFVLEIRTVLLVDNCPGHGTVSGLQLLPPNTTAKLQPVDHWVISSPKRHYWQSLLQRMLLCMEAGKEYQVDLLSAVCLPAATWAKVSATTISNCYYCTGFLRPHDNSKKCSAVIVKR